MENQNMEIKGFRTNSEGVKEILNFLDSEDNKGYEEHTDNDGNLKSTEHWAYFISGEIKQIRNVNSILYNVDMEFTGKRTKESHNAFAKLTDILKEIYK